MSATVVDPGTPIESTTFSPIAALHPTPQARTLAWVLATLGHSCCGAACFAALADSPVRLAWHGAGLRSVVVVLDTHLVENAATDRLHLRQINACTRAHGIRVVSRHCDDRGHALAALDPSPA